MFANVLIYTRPGCGYCSAAISLLQRKSVPFTQRDIATNPAAREEMIQRSNGGSTFPQIFIGNRHIGGCDDLYALDRDGKLDAMLKGQNA